jgi:hypothetical protein
MKNEMEKKVIQSALLAAKRQLERLAADRNNPFVTAESISATLAKIEAGMDELKIED